MASEGFRLATPARLFVFIATNNAERLNALGKALENLGAKAAGPQAFWIGDESASPETIRDALEGLKEGECVYAVSASDLGLQTDLIVAPRAEGGITVGED